MFRKKKPKRLYYPVKSSWYTRPRRRRKTTIKRSFSLSKVVRSFLKDFPYFVLVLIGFVIISVFFVFSSYFTLADIEVVRKDFNIDSIAIENELKGYIGQNIFSLSKDEIYRSIASQFPEFASIRVKKVFPSKIMIDLEAYPIVANLRAYYILPEPEDTNAEDFTELNRAIEALSSSDPDLADALVNSPLEESNAAKGIFDLSGTEVTPEKEIKEQKALLNQVGQAIFDQQEDLSLIYINIRGLSQPIQDREKVMEADHMQYLLDAIQYLYNQLSMNVVQIDYLPIAREIHLKTDSQLMLWLTIEKPYQDQINKLATIYDPAELSKEDLSYIDLRIREKVIYCLRGATCDQ